MDNSKYLIVGDKGVGKMCLYMTYTCGSFPGEYRPTCFDHNYAINGILDTELFAIRVWIGIDQDEFDKLRVLAYPDTAVVLICFGVDKKSSLERVKEKWLPEVRQHCQEIPVVLVACKIDLRSSKKDDTDVISQKEGSNVAKELGIHYFETSSLTQAGIKECFEFCKNDAVYVSKQGYGTLICNNAGIRHNNRIYRF